MNYAFRILSGALLGAWCVTTASAQMGAEFCNPIAPKTHAGVKADLAAWRAAGYDPLDWINYPENAIRAGRIVAKQRAQASYACPR